MISFEQCKHVIQYYVMRMTTDEPIQVAPHIQRDCVYLNKMRGELCANVASNPILGPVIKLLHGCNTIGQVNSVPVGVSCFIDKKQIPTSSAGIQLIVHAGDKITHICIAKKYQQSCYAYFKLRHFDSFIERHVKDWLSHQEWYVPKTYTSEHLIRKIMNSSVPNATHTHLTEAADVFLE